MRTISLLALFVTVAYGQLVGGFTSQNPSNYTEQSWKAVPQINAESNDQSYLVPIKVVSAETQVVAGTNTELEVLVGESTCQKGGSVQLSQINIVSCPVAQGGARALYKVSIWEKPWMNFEQITAEKVRDVPAGEVI